jgi:hypothetical protein
MSDNRTRLWFALFVLAVFCMGAAAGLFIGGRLGDGDRPGRFREAPGEGRAEDRLPAC